MDARRATKASAGVLVQYVEAAEQASLRSGIRKGGALQDDPKAKSRLIGGRNRMAVCSEGMPE